jgi:hypothetical protein
MTSRRTSSPRRSPRREPRQSDTPFAEPWSLEQWPNVPTRVLAGRHDRLFPLEFMRRLALERLNIVADVIDTGHLPALSRTNWCAGWRPTACTTRRPQRRPNSESALLDGASAPDSRRRTRATPLRRCGAPDRLANSPTTPSALAAHGMSVEASTSPSRRPVSVRRESAQRLAVDARFHGEGTLCP